MFHQRLILVLLASFFGSSVFLDASQSAAQTAQDPLALRLTDVVSTYAPNCEPLGAIQFGALAEGDSFYVDIPVERDRCYSVVAVGEPSARDIDLHLYAGQVQLASHTASDNIPVVHWCNAAFTRLSAEVRMYAGSGRFAFQVFVGRLDPESRDPNLWAAMDAFASQYVQGWVPAAPPVRGILPSGGEDEYSLRLAAGRCYIFVGVGAPSVTDLDLFLYDSQQTLLDSDDNPEAQAVLRTCVEQGAGGDFLVKVRLVAGYGEYGLQFFGN